MLDVQTLSPYWELQMQGAHPGPTILLRKHSLPILSLMSLLRKQHYIAATVVLTALLSEFLVITLSGLPYRAGQLPGELYFCAVLSLTLLALMIVMLIVVNVWRRMLPSLPRNPDSMAAVMMHVSGSQMCRDFHGTEHLPTNQRDQRILSLKKRYFYGFFGHGEKGRWVVDELPTGNYRNDRC